MESESLIEWGFEIPRDYKTKMEDDKRVVGLLEKSSREEEIIRHDRKNLLITLQTLIEEGQYEEAEKMRKQIWAKEGFAE